MLLFQQMLVLFVYMMIGYFCSKRKLFHESFGNNVSWLVVNISNPMMILSSVINGDGSVKTSELLLTGEVAILIFAFLLVLATFIPKILKLNRKEAGYFQLMTVFNNVAFMGFPLISSIYGSGALLYAAVFLLPYNLLFYTYGINVVSPTKQKFNWKKICNAGVIASILAVVFYLTQLPIPQFIKTVTQGLSNVNAPLSMIVIGISLSKFNLKELFLDQKMLIFAGMKLILIPIIGMCIVKQFVSIPTLQGVCMIVLATPAGSMTAMLAQQMGGNYKKVAQGVALTTLLSVFTIPLVSLIVL